MSSELRLIGAEELRARLPMEAAVDALEEAFRTLDAAGGPLRTHVDTPAGTLLLMPAFGEAGIGVKLVSLTPRIRVEGYRSSTRATCCSIPRRRRPRRCSRAPR